MVHAQAAHMINIYELGTRAPSPSRSPSLDQPKESTPSPQDFQVNSHSSYVLSEIYYLRRRHAAIFYKIAQPELKN